MKQKIESHALQPMVMLEINEIPWKLLDYLLATGRYPALKEFLANSQTYTTLADEDGELSPWITWPSLHRGMNGRDHGTRFLGQEANTISGRPIWEEYIRGGNSIGIFGCLQSWPAKYPGKGGFYIPDTFAKDEKCFPVTLNAFQAFNLKQTSENGRVIRPKSFRIREMIEFIVSTARTGLRGKTFLALVKQFLLEKIDPRYCARRPTFQGILQWDIFLHLYNQNSPPPPYAAFFTNHIASSMHRFWHHLFPADFLSPVSPPSPIQSGNILFACKVLEQILGDALNLQRKNPKLIVVMASSMGQGPAQWARFEGLATIIKFPQKLFRAINPATDWDREATFSLAMVPQVIVTIENASIRTAMIEFLEAAITKSGAKLFFVQQEDTQLCISIRTPAKADIEAAGFSLGLSGPWSTWEESGIEVTEVEPGSGYHVPEGILVISRTGVTPNQGRDYMPLRNVKSLLMEMSGLGKQTTSQ